MQSSVLECSLYTGSLAKMRCLLNIISKYFCNVFNVLNSCVFLNEFACFRHYKGFRSYETKRWRNLATLVQLLCKVCITEQQFTSDIYLTGLCVVKIPSVVYFSVDVLGPYRFSYMSQTVIMVCIIYCSDDYLNNICFSFLSQDSKSLYSHKECPRITIYLVYQQKQVSWQRTTNSWEV